MSLLVKLIDERRILLLFWQKDQIGLDRPVRPWDEVVTMMCFQTRLMVNCSKAKWDINKRKSTIYQPDLLGIDNTQYCLYVLFLPKKSSSNANQPCINLISWASMVPPPSASKAVKIQLSLLSGELRSPTLFALMVKLLYWYNCISLRKSTCNYLIVLLETESPTVVVVEDFEERFGKHSVLWRYVYIFSSFILIFDFENLHQLIWHLERYNLPFWTRGNLLWGWALPEIVHGTDPTPQAPPPSPSRILPPGFLQLRSLPPPGFSFEISSPSFGLSLPSCFSETFKSLFTLGRRLNTGLFFSWPPLFST